MAYVKNTPVWRELETISKPSSDWSKKKNEFEIVNGKIEQYYNIVVHEFTVANFDDPDVYAAQPLWEWQQTEKGKWIMEHAVEAPTWTKSINHERYEYRFVVVAKLESKDYTYYQLKFN